MAECKYCKGKDDFLKSEHPEAKKNILRDARFWHLSYFKHLKAIQQPFSGRPPFSSKSLKGMNSWFAYNFIVNQNKI